MNRRGFQQTSVVMIAALTSLYASWASAQEAPAREKEEGKLPALHILEAGNSNKIVVQNADKVGPLVFHIEETNGVDVADLKIHIRLHTPDGTPISDMTCALDGSSDTKCSELQGALKARKWASLTVRPSIKEWKSGTYKGQLILLSEKVRLTTDLELIKADEPASPAIEMIAPAEVYGTCGKASFSLLLSQNQNSPKFYLNSVKCGEEVQREFHLDSIPTGTASSEPTKYSGSVSNLPRAGDCEGELVANAGGKQLAKKSIKIYTRYHWGWGVGLIAFGVTLSGVLRYFIINKSETRKLTERVLLQLNALEQFENAAKPLDEKEKQIIETLRAMFLETRERLRLFANKPEEKHIASIERQVALLKKWVPVYRRRRALRGLQDGDRTLIDDALESAEQVLRGDAQGSPDFDKLSEALKKAQETIDSALRAQVDAFLEDVKAQDEELLAELAPVVDEIKTVKKALEANEYERAKEFFDRARLAYVRVLAKKLREIVQGSKASFPADETAWSLFQREMDDKISGIDAAKDADVAVSDYQEAYLHYLRRMLPALVRQEVGIRSRMDALIEKKNPLERELQAAQQTVTKALGQAKTAIEDDDFSKAKQSYNEAVQAIKAFDELVRKGEGGGKQSGALTSLLGAIAPMGGGSLISSLAAWLVPMITLPSSGGGTSQRWQFELAKLNRMTAKEEVLIQLVVFVVAVMLGTKVLGLDAQTWGTCGDMLNAFLWGIGLSQVSGTAFQGLPNLRDKLVKPTTAAS